MKLVRCGDCGDIFPLDTHLRRCECGRTAGAYDRDLWGAWISGAKAVPLGFRNASFGLAIKNRPQRSPGREFIAFVVERDCPTVREQDAPPTLSSDQLWDKGRGVDRRERVLNQLRLAWELNSPMPFGEFLALALGPKAGSKALSRMTDEELGKRLHAAKRTLAKPIGQRYTRKKR
jgi:hypothetical protein